MKKSSVTKLIDDFRSVRLTTVAGAWVYYFLTSLIPLVFLLVSAFSVFGVSLTRDFVSRLPIEFREAGFAIASTAENASNGATVFFFITAIFSCTTLLNQMSKDGDYIYGARSKHKRGLMRRLWAVFALGLLFLLFLGIALLFAFSSLIKNNLASFVERNLFLTTFVFLFTIMFSYAIIILLNKFISPIKLKLKHLTFGSFISLAIMVLGTIGFTLYLRFFASYNAFYGSLAGVIIFLFWAYILMIGLVSGVVINNHVFSRDKIKEKSQSKAFATKESYVKNRKTGKVLSSRG